MVLAVCKKHFRYGDLSAVSRQGRQACGTSVFNRAVQTTVAPVFREVSWKECLVGFFSPWAALGIGGYPAPALGAVPISARPAGLGAPLVLLTRVNFNPPVHEGMSHAWLSCPMAQN